MTKWFLPSGRLQRHSTEKVDIRNDIRRQRVIEPKKEKPDAKEKSNADE